MIPDKSAVTLGVVHITDKWIVPSHELPYITLNDPKTFIEFVRNTNAKWIAICYDDDTVDPNIKHVVRMAEKISEGMGGGGKTDNVFAIFTPMKFEIRPDIIVDIHPRYTSPGVYNVDLMRRFMKPMETIHDTLVSYIDDMKSNGYTELKISIPMYISRTFGVYDVLRHYPTVMTAERLQSIFPSPDPFPDVGIGFSNDRKRILMLQEFLCVRGLKTAVFFRSLGYDVVYGLRTTEIMWNLFDIFNSTVSSAHVVPTPTTLEKLIDKVKPIAVHFHNYPDVLFHWIPDDLRIPIVYDCHDVPSVAFTVSSTDEAEKLLENERKAFEKADHVITVSKSQSDYIRSNYPDTDVRYFPTAIPSAILDRLEFEPHRFDRSVVYSGEIAKGTYRDISDYIKRLSDEGYTVFVHGVAPSKIGDVIENTSAYFAGTRDLKTNIESLSRYDLGLLVFNEKYFGRSAANVLGISSEHSGHHTLPNKAFEYIAAGIPIIVSPFMKNLRETFEGAVATEPSAALELKGFDIGRYRIRMEDHFDNIKDIYE